MAECKYNTSQAEQSHLTEFAKAKRPACNAEFLIGSLGLIKYAYRVASEIPPHIRDEFFPAYADQSFLNYLLYAYGIEIKLISYHIKDASPATWAQQWVVRTSGGSLVYGKEKGSQPDVKNDPFTGPAFLHWAGLKLSPTMAKFNLFLEDALPAMGWSSHLSLIKNLLRIDPFLWLRRRPWSQKYFCCQPDSQAIHCNLCYPASI
jgi:hypothetical protein